MFRKVDTTETYQIPHVIILREENIVVETLNGALVGGDDGSGEECWGQRGENNGVTKAALFHSCGRGKTGISQG